MFKYGVFSGPYFPVFGLNTGTYGPEKTPYLGTFEEVLMKERIYFRGRELQIWGSTQEMPAYG